MGLPCTFTNYSFSCGNGKGINRLEIWIAKERNLHNLIVRFDDFWGQSARCFALATCKGSRADPTFTQTRLESLKSFEPPPPDRPALKKNVLTISRKKTKNLKMLNSFKTEKNFIKENIFKKTLFFNGFCLLLLGNRSLKVHATIRPTMLCTAARIDVKAETKIKPPTGYWAAKKTAGPLLCKRKKNLKFFSPCYCFHVFPHVFKMLCLKVWTFILLCKVIDLFLTALL